MLYIELLEVISESFKKLFNLAKDFRNACDDKMCETINQLENKLKLIIHTPQQMNRHVYSNLNDNSTKQSTLNLSLEYKEQFSDDYSPPIQNDLTEEKFNNSDFKSSTPDTSFDEKLTNAVSKTICKRSSSLNSIQPSNDTTNFSELSNQSDDQPNKPKIKFSLKRPSSVSSKISDGQSAIVDMPSNTLERVKNAAGKLQPLLTEETSKCRPVPASSVPFQPQALSKESLINSNYVETESSSVDKRNTFEVDLDKEKDMSVINDSITFEDNDDGASQPSRRISVDEEGWQVYRPEDFENDIDFSEPSVSHTESNTIDQTVNDSCTIYEGMGDFHPGTKNDGNTGE